MLRRILRSIFSCFSNQNYIISPQSVYPYHTNHKDFVEISSDKIIDCQDFSCSEDLDDRYLCDFIIPFTLFSNNNSNIFNDTTDYREQFFRFLLKAGFETDKIEKMFSYYPTCAKYEFNLIAEYIINTPLCSFLEQTTDPNYVTIRLDGESKKKNLNALSSILRESLYFSSVVLIFKYIPNQMVNFLKLDHLIYNGKKIEWNDRFWHLYLSSAFTELFCILQIFHGFWHLVTAHVLYVLENTCSDTDIFNFVKVYRHEVYRKASEVKNVFFGSKVLFNQVLNNNILFCTFMDRYMKNVFINFNSTQYNYIFFPEMIDQPKQDDQNNNQYNYNDKWIPGFSKNISTISSFVHDLMNKRSHQEENLKILRFCQFNYHGNIIYKIDKKAQCNLYQHYLEIFFIFGGTFHSTSFDFGKLFFTDLIDLSRFDPNVGSLLLSCITVYKNSNFLGDIIDTEHTGHTDDIDHTESVYQNEIIDFQKNLTYDRQSISLMIKNNKYFYPSTFSTRKDAENMMTINSPTAYI